MELREYQQASIDAIYNEFRDGQQAALGVLPTGAGKAVVLAKLAEDVANCGGRVVILAHVKELLQQAVDKIKAINPGLRVGIYSAGLGSKDTGHDILVAGIQSVYNQASRLGRRDIVIIDEAHRIPESSDTRYRIFISELMVENPDLKICGLTATPFRMDDGPIHGEGQLFPKVCHEVKIPELIAQGFLSQLRNKTDCDEALPDLREVRSRNGDFVQGEMEDCVNQDSIVDFMIRDIMVKARGRRTILVFAVGLDHAANIWRKLCDMGELAAIVTGDTPSPERAKMIEQFRGGDIRFLVNCMVLTEGFDAPNIDCVVLARPTESAGLYYQMVGRGFRIHKSKQDCLIIDYGKNIRRNGPVDAIKIKPKGKGEEGIVNLKTCPKCGEFCSFGTRECPDCGFPFPAPERSMPEREADQESPILSSQIEPEKKKVLETHYAIHQKRNAPDDAPRTLKVTYSSGLADEISEWICVEHTGFAKEKANRWWAKRCRAKCPDSVADALALARSGALAHTIEIELLKKPGEKFPSIIKYKLGPVPELLPSQPEETEGNEQQDLPF